MSINLEQDGFPQEQVEEEKLRLLVYRAEAGIRVEIVRQDELEVILCDEIIWPESYGVYDAEKRSKLNRVEQTFYANPDDIGIQVLCHSDGFMIEVVTPETVVSYYRLEYEKWGFEKDDSMSVSFT